MVEPGRELTPSSTPDVPPLPDLVARPFSLLQVMAVNPGPVTFGGRTFSQMEKLIVTSVFSVLTIFYFSSMGSLLFYAALSGVGLIAIHGSLRTPENLFSDDGPAGTEMNSPTNFLTAFSGAFAGLMKSTNSSAQPVESAV